MMTMIISKVGSDKRESQGFRGCFENPDNSQFDFLFIASETKHE